MNIRAHAEWKAAKCLALTDGDEDAALALMDTPDEELDRRLNEKGLTVPQPGPCPMGLRVPTMQTANALGWALLKGGAS